ncbi:hypothetical protein BJX61DRAFT_417185 [Aspergillus egyptiacus]|nr:hypothetical protein BJX61DRAFT_417185 [Aspergillus egyptiacus]
MSPQHPTSKTTIYLDQPPSCLQFCPASPNNLVIGTYLLSEIKESESSIQQTKTGSLQLWNLNPESHTLKKLSHHHIPAAVFNLHFHPRNPQILAIATSDARISLFAVSEETGFTHLSSHEVHEDPSIPALFLAWMPENFLRGPPGPGPGDGFAVTFSDGRTGVFEVDVGAVADRANASANANANANADAKANDGNDDQIEKGEPVSELATISAKQPIEVWFVALASYPAANPTVSEETQEEEEEEKKKKKKYTPYLFTGNDFGTLQTTRFEDVEPAGTSSIHGGNEEDESPGNLPATISTIDDRARHHTAGVTSILPLGEIPLSSTGGEPLILTGSYDECLRVYHARGRGDVIAEEGLGGGVWRLQVLRSSASASAAVSAGEGEQEEVWTFLVLASCMHAGTRVVRVTVTTRGEGEPGAEIEVLAEFTEHESMNYASDVWRATGMGEVDDSEEMLVVSSSFYDRRVCVWRVKV